MHKSLISIYNIKTNKLKIINKIVRSTNLDNQILWAKMMMMWDFKEKSDRETIFFFFCSKMTTDFQYRVFRM